MKENAYMNWVFRLKSFKLFLILYLPTLAGGGGNGTGTYPKAFVNLLVVDKNLQFY